MLEFAPTIDSRRVPAMRHVSEQAKLRIRVVSPIPLAIPYKSKVYDMS